MQVAGTAAQSATGLETPPSPSSSSQVTSSVTQIQIGCISECFGTTTTNAATAALIQQFLSDFNSLQPACGSSTTEPTAATLESVVDQVACQVQDAETGATQNQVASQSSATVQVSDSAPASQPPAPPASAQTEQGTWQLQIGCVFYCTGTEQLQQAQQSITIINVQAGLSGSNPSSVDVTTQIVWQLQIGCVAWCYDATQVQVAGQSTVIVDESPSPPSPPPPAPAPADPTPATPTPDVAGPAPQAGPVAGPPTATASGASSVGGSPPGMVPPVRRVRLFKAVSLVGGSVSAWIMPVGTVAQVQQAIIAPLPMAASSAPTMSDHVSVQAVSQPHARRSSRLAAGPHADHPVLVAEALAPDPRVPTDVPVVQLLVAAAAALLALAAVWTQLAAKSKR